MHTKKRAYTAPQLKEIYIAPRLTKHGSVAQLTGSAFVPGYPYGNEGPGPPAISAPAVPGQEEQPKADPGQQVQPKADPVQQVQPKADPVQQVQPKAEGDQKQRFKADGGEKK